LPLGGCAHGGATVQLVSAANLLYLASNGCPFVSEFAL